jgi:hypothetical protein
MELAGSRRAFLKKHGRRGKSGRATEVSEEHTMEPPISAPEEDIYDENDKESHGEEVVISKIVHYFQASASSTDVFQFVFAEEAVSLTWSTEPVHFSPLFSF